MYNTYLTLNLPVCKVAGVRSVQIVEINFLRKIINQEINGSVDLTSKIASDFDIFCLKEHNYVSIENLKSSFW